jgi:hypothetical protein
MDKDEIKTEEYKSWKIIDRVIGGLRAEVLKILCFIIKII